MDKLSTIDLDYFGHFRYYFDDSILPDMLFTPFRLFIILVIGIATIGWQQRSFPAVLFAQFSQTSQRDLASGARYRISENRSFATDLTRAALDRAGRVVRYDASYKVITFPNGDVPSNTGCGTDEIIRSYREVGVDLQELVFLDMVESFGAYPRVKGKTKPDTNIDHRQVANLQAFFKRNGVTLSPSRVEADYAPGDIITCTLPKGQPHIAMLVPAPGSGRPWIIHNMGMGPRLEDRLFDFTITGHYRYHPRG